MLVVACFAIGMAATAAAASGPSSASGMQALAPTPYMGWNTYYGVGGVYDQRTIISVATAILRRGLARAGYRIVWLDFGWASGVRDQSGTLIADRRQWPNGLRWLTGWLHSHGLLAGIYTDAGVSGCSHRGVGSLSHYQQDADTFAGWGFDAVKVDFCGAGQEGLSPRPLYHEFARALQNNSSRRPMLLNVCNFWVPGQIDRRRPSLADSAYSNALWAPKIAQSWRTDTDIGFTGNVVFQNVLRNLDHDAAHPKRARTGHWNDPDYLAPQLGMTPAEAQAQMTMWAVVAAPLILGSDPRELSPETIKMLTNPDVIAVDQDPLGIQGTRVREQGSVQIWVKPLAGGARAVAILNRGSTEAQITTTRRAVRLAQARRYAIENLWTHTSITTAGEIRARIAPHAAVLLRVSAL
jgi:alpha-galactosidase